MKTLTLDNNWDLQAVNGNIGTNDGPAAIAQDVSSAVRLFSGELWYDTTQGVPYFQQILGKPPAAGVLNARISAAALTVPGVIRVRCAFDLLGTNRTLTGSIRITDDRGQTITVSLSTPWYINAVKDFP